jgi:hypothetical protein
VFHSSEVLRKQWTLQHGNSITHVTTIDAIQNVTAYVTLLFCRRREGMRYDEKWSKERRWAGSYCVR